MFRKQIGDYLVFLVVRVVICIAQAVRIETGAAVASWLAWLFGDVLRLRAKVIDGNLAHAFPEMSPAKRLRLARRMWEHLFLLALEVAHAPRKIHETNWRDYITLTDDDKIVRMTLDDRPMLVITAHFGNFEVAGYTMGLLAFPTNTVARTLDNPYLDRFVARFRSITRQRIIPKNGGYDQILEVLNSGGTMAFLADQYAGPKGCWVDFFNRKASAYKAIALLALEHDAPVAVTSGRRLGKPLHIELRTFATIDPRDARDEVGTIHELTQWYTTAIEEIVRLAPEQYWWVHRRWKDTRKKRRQKRQAA